MAENNIVFIPITLDELKGAIKKALSELLMEQKEKQDDFMTIKEVCHLLQISSVTLDTWRKDKWIKYYRFGSRIRFKRSDVMNMQEHKRPNPNKKSKK